MNRGDAFLSTFFISIAIVFGMLALNLIESSRAGIGPGSWPFLVCLIIFINGIVVLVSSFKLKNTTENNYFTKDKARVYLTILTLLIYFFCMIYFGFFVSTLLMLFFLTFNFSTYKWYKSITVSLIITFIVYFIFHNMLNVSFKFGMFF